MELIVESMIMNKDDFKEKLYEMMEKIDIAYDFIKKDKDNKSKFELSIEEAKIKYSDIKDIIESVLSDLKKEWSFFNTETKIIIKENESQYWVTLAVALDLELLVDWNMEKTLHKVKDNMKVRIKRLNKTYVFESNYGVYDNEWYLVAVEESLSEKLNLEPHCTNILKRCIECQQEEMEEEDYDLHVTCFYCIDDEENYDTDYYCNKNIESYLIKDCYIEDDMFMIELY